MLAARGGRSEAMAAPAGVPMRKLDVVNGATAPQQRSKVAPAVVPYWRLLRCCSQHSRGEQAPLQGLRTEQRPVLNLMPQFCRSQGPARSCSLARPPRSQTERRFPCLPL